MSSDGIKGKFTLSVYVNICMCICVKFNIVSMMMLMLMQRMGIEPICLLLPLLLLFSKMQRQTLMLSVNGPLSHHMLFYNEKILVQNYVIRRK